MLFMLPVDLISLVMQGSKELIKLFQYFLRWCALSRFPTGQRAWTNADLFGQECLADPQELAPPFDIFG